MKREQFLNLIIEKRKIDKEIFELSKQIEDFPLAFSILKKISDSIHFGKFLNSTNQGTALTEIRDLYLNNVAIIKDSSLKNESKKFVDDLSSLKLFKLRKSRVSISQKGKKDKDEYELDFPEEDYYQKNVKENSLIGRSFSDKELKVIAKEFPELALKEITRFDPGALMTKPSLDQIVVSFLQTQCEVFVEPRNVGEWNGWDTLTAFSQLFSAQGDTRNIASTMFYANRSNQVSDSAEDWRTWKMWSLEQEDFKRYKSKVFNEIDCYNAEIEEDHNNKIRTIEIHNAQVREKLKTSSIIRKIEKHFKKLSDQKMTLEELPKFMDIYQWKDYAIYRSLIYKPIPSPQMWDEYTKKLCDRDQSLLGMFREPLYNIYKQLEVFFDRELFENPYYGDISSKTKENHGGYINHSGDGLKREEWRIKMQNAAGTITGSYWMGDVITCKIKLKTFAQSRIIRSDIKNYPKISNAIQNLYDLISPLEKIDIWELKRSKSWNKLNKLLIKDIEDNNELLPNLFNHLRKIFKLDKSKILQINENLENDYWFIDMFQFFFKKEVLNEIYKNRKIPPLLYPKNLTKK